MSYHTLIIVGNIGSDPDMRHTPTGQAVTTFTVASHRQRTENGGISKETVWFRVITWGKMAEVCHAYLRKGMKVFVEGRLNPDPETGGPRVWMGKNGQPRASFEVTAGVVRFLSSRSDSGTSTTDEEVDIPF